MHTFVISIFLLTGFLWKSQAHGVPKTITLEWYCEQSVEFNFFPPRNISITYDPRKKTSDLSLLNAFIARLEKKPQFDYSQCLEATLKPVLQIHDFPVSPQQIFNSYRDKARKLGGVYPVIPGGVTLKKYKAVGPANPALACLSQAQIQGEKLSLSLLEEVIAPMTKAKSMNDVECAKAYLINLSQDLLSARPSPRYCKNYPRECQLINNGIAQSRSRIAKLLPFSVIDTLPDSSQCQSQPEDVIQELQKKTTCTQVAINENIEITGVSGAGLPLHYFLKWEKNRAGNDTFTATVPLYFKRKLDFFESFFRENNEAFDLAWRSISQQCFDDLKDSMLGPQGEKLRIIIAESRDYTGADTVVVDPIKRDNSTHWNPLINCPTIVHEVMHHMGLQDMYNEEFAGTDNEKVITRAGVQKTAFNCRALSPEDSIMANETAAIDAVRPQFIVDTCVCSPKDSSGSLFTRGAHEECLISMINWQSKISCPIETTVTPILIPRARNQMEALNEAKYKATSQAAIVLDVVHELPRRKKSLFYPAEFRALVHPGCVRGNASFYRCSQFAYKSSYDRNGIPNCQVPQECKDKEFKWLK